MDLRKLVGNRPIVTVGASAVILDRDSSVLLIKRNDNNLWALPAGSTEINENPQTTAIREIQEETGLLVNEDDLTLIQVFGGEDFFYTYPNGDQCSNVVVSYLVKKTHGSLITKTDETTCADFFSFENLPDNIANHEKIILDYYKSNVIGRSSF